MTVELRHAYATVDDLREHLGDSKQNLPENLLNRALNAASRAVDNHCWRRFWQDETPTTRTVKAGYDCNDLWLTGRDDISTTTGLAVATWDGSGYGTTWTQDTDYQLWPYDANTDGSIYGGWSRLEGLGTIDFRVPTVRAKVYRPVQITARWGWSFIPDEVEQATLFKAAQLFKRKDAPFGIMQFGDIAAVRVTRADIDVLELLAPYQRDVAMVG